MISTIDANTCKIYWKKHTLNFVFQAGTSRGILTQKDAYYVIIENAESRLGIGECCVLKGLSIDDKPDFEIRLQQACDYLKKDFPNGIESLTGFFNRINLEQWPAIKMGIETALYDYWNGGNQIIFNNDFIEGKSIPINGLIWMGSREFMLDQIRKKLSEGYTTLKMKIGAISFESELALLRYIRQEYPSSEISLRVDANGSFDFLEAPQKLDALAKLDIHSIEQPIRTGQWEKMAQICHSSPIPVALDEELIGIKNTDRRRELLDFINPQFIILKPSLLGGFHETNHWIHEAGERNIGWWITSALESNIGLNAIAQFTSSKNVSIEQGLGTGQLFKNNIPSPLYISEGHLKYDNHQKWDLSLLEI